MKSLRLRMNRFDCSLVPSFRLSSGIIFLTWMVIKFTWQRFCRNNKITPREFNLIYWIIFAGGISLLWSEKTLDWVYYVSISKGVLESHIQFAPGLLLKQKVKGNSVMSYCCHTSAKLWLSYNTKIEETANQFDIKYNTFQSYTFYLVLSLSARRFSRNLHVILRRNYFHHYYHRRAIYHEKWASDNCKQ